MGDTLKADAAVRPLKMLNQRPVLEPGMHNASCETRRSARSSGMTGYSYRNMDAVCRAAVIFAVQCGTILLSGLEDHTRAAVQVGRTRGRAGFPMTIAPAGTLRVTTAPMPTVAPLPITMGASGAPLRMIAPDPTYA